MSDRTTPAERAAHGATPAESPIVSTGGGILLGSWSESVAAFRGIPYAAAPVGPFRFAPPRPASRWAGVRSAQRPAAAPPQPAGRGDPVMGPMDVPAYDEDCLTLNVWTPAPGSAKGLPVVVWFHGGGLLVGAGSAAWYDGSVMARRGNVVVVSVNYRLGALGYLYLPAGTVGAEAAANFGLQDQCLALEWVRDNIAAFGGDARQVTVAGQSAGGVSIVALCAVPRAAGLFQRAILQSSGLSMPAKSPAQAQKVTDLFFDAVGVARGDGKALRDLPVARILEGQGQVLMRCAQALGFDPRLCPMAMVPFRHVVDGEVLPVEHTEAALRGSMDKLDLLLMTTSEEMRFAYAAEDAFWQRDRDSLIAGLQKAWGLAGTRLFEAYERPGQSAAETLVNMISVEGSGATYQLAEHRARSGRPAHFAYFTWRSPAVNGRVGAAHTVELPFVFNNPDNWSRAPMFTAGDPDEVRQLAEKMQDAWIAFIRTGLPGDSRWPAYVLPERAAMEFGASVGVVRDVGGGRRNLIDFMRAERA